VPDLPTCSGSVADHRLSSCRTSSRVNPCEDFSNGDECADSLPEGISERQSAKSLTSSRVAHGPWRGTGAEKALVFFFFLKTDDACPPSSFQHSQNLLPVRKRPAAESNSQSAKGKRRSVLRRLQRLSRKESGSSGFENSLVSNLGTTDRHAPSARNGR